MTTSLLNSLLRALLRWGAALVFCLPLRHRTHFWARACGMLFPLLLLAQLLDPLAQSTTLWQQQLLLLRVLRRSQRHNVRGGSTRQSVQTQSGMRACRPPGGVGSHMHSGSDVTAINKTYSHYHAKPEMPFKCLLTGISPATVAAQCGPDPVLPPCLP